MRSPRRAWPTARPRGRGSKRLAALSPCGSACCWFDNKVSGSPGRPTRKLPNRGLFYPTRAFLGTNAVPRHGHDQRFRGPRPALYRRKAGGAAPLSCQPCPFHDLQTSTKRKADADLAKMCGQEFLRKRAVWNVQGCTMRGNPATGRTILRRGLRNSCFAAPSSWAVNTCTPS